MTSPWKTKNTYDNQKMMAGNSDASNNVASFTNKAMAANKKGRHLIGQATRTWHNLIVRPGFIFGTVCSIVFVCYARFSI